MLPPARIALDLATAPHAAFLLRLTLGVVFMAHGLFKVLVLTLPGTAAFFAAQGFPGWTAYPVFAAEVVGGAALLAGSGVAAASSFFSQAVRPVASATAQIRDAWVTRRVVDMGARG